MRDFAKLKILEVSTAAGNTLVGAWCTYNIFFFFFFFFLCVMVLMSAIGPEMTGDG